MWTVFVGLVRLAMITAAHLTGGSIGSGILLVSAAVRLALLPLTLRAAREARANPGKPGRAQLQSALVQMPLLGALVSAVRGGFAAGTRFLWIRDLSQPSVMLAGLVASLSVAIAATAPRGANQ